MRFLRQMGAVILIVAVVVLGGLAWNHFDASSLVGNLATAGPRQFPVGGGHFKAGPGVQVARGGRVIRPGPHGVRIVRGPNGRKIFIDSRGFDLGLTSMLDPVNWPVIRDTVGIEAGAIAAVILLDFVRLRRRRARRLKLIALARAGVPDSRVAQQEGG